MPIGEALRLAQDSELDLVEVAPMARPPVVKLMDYGKFKYESAQKAREARRTVLRRRVVLGAYCSAAAGSAGCSGEPR